MIYFFNYLQSDYWILLAKKVRKSAWKVKKCTFLRHPMQYVSSGELIMHTSTLQIGSILLPHPRHNIQWVRSVPECALPNNEHWLLFALLAVEQPVACWSVQNANYRLLMSMHVDTWMYMQIQEVQRGNTTKNKKSVIDWNRESLGKADHRNMTFFIIGMINTFHYTDGSSN